MLDLGGGSGRTRSHSPRLLRTCSPRSSTWLMFCRLPKNIFAKRGLEERITTRPGDMLTVPLETGKYDLVLLSAICHMFSPHENQQLLNRAYTALAPQGRLVISDFVLEPDKTAPQICSVILAEYVSGHRDLAPATASPSTRDWMKQAGFAETKLIAYAGSGEPDDRNQVAANCQQDC